MAFCGGHGMGDGSLEDIVWAWECQLCGWRSRGTFPTLDEAKADAQQHRQRAHAQDEEPPQEDAP